MVELRSAAAICEEKASLHLEILKENRTIKLQILPLCSQRKRHMENRKINEFFNSLIFSFLPLSEILAEQISPPANHKEFIEKSRKI